MHASGFHSGRLEEDGDRTNEAKALGDTVAPVQWPKRPGPRGVATPRTRPTALPSTPFIDRPDASKLGHSWPGLPTSLQICPGSGSGSDRAAARLIRPCFHPRERSRDSVYTRPSLRDLFSNRATQIGRTRRPDRTGTAVESLLMSLHDPRNTERAESLIGNAPNCLLLGHNNF